MKITIMNGAAKTAFPQEYQSLVDLNNALGGENEISQFDIKDLDIKPCTGCWTCWVNDPGMCIHKDDMVGIYKSVNQSDILLIVSDIKAGFIDSDVKKTVERQFALLLPYMTNVNDEFHHIPRYNHQPKIGLVIVGADNHDAEQQEILKEYVYRLSLNFNKDTGNFLHYLNPNNMEELAYEINNI